MYDLNVKIKVFPKDRSILKKKKKPYEEQTIVAETSNGIIYYYSHILKKMYGIEVDKSSFKAHITINNGREPIRLDNKYLKQIENKLLTVKYNPKPYILWKFIALEIHSKELVSIRNKLGLSSDFKFHLTIGKIKDKCIPITSNNIENNKINFLLKNINVKKGY